MSETEETPEQQMKRVMETAEAEAAKAPEPEGLQKLFTAGDMIPMKGIWFVIEDVSPNRLRLRPKEMTAARRKEVSNARR